jgi:hypothetical protein
MKLGDSFADNPGSGSNPANRFAFKRMLPNQKLQTVEALFAYVSEWERAIAERDANRLAEKNGIADAGMRNQFRSAFVRLSVPTRTPNIGKITTANCMSTAVIVCDCIL